MSYNYDYAAPEQLADVKVAQKTMSSNIGSRQDAMGTHSRPIGGGRTGPSVGGAETESRPSLIVAIGKYILGTPKGGVPEVDSAQNLANPKPS
jgi:hypothetical protein